MLVGCKLVRFGMQFNKENGRVVEEFKLRVIYIPANPPSPVPEGSEEGTPPRASMQENGNQNVSSYEDVSVLCCCWQERKYYLFFSPCFYQLLMENGITH